MADSRKTKGGAGPPEGSGLGRAMWAIAVVAVGLALARGMEPMVLGAYGPLLALMLWLLYEAVIRRRRLEGFHYATAIVTAPAAGFLARQVAMGRFRPLGPAVRFGRWAAGDLGRHPRFSWIVEAAEFGAGGS
ncbi:hypothetical protein [Paludisphaera mucosa]|uniref:Uncharacterized protein n=1 Tax=Paludisphaera mucosa TaxID=3030827 RepID=A0ABT6FBA0_9BACT|nr:hypothetical protein [Paludisphaera mucosa]MDG3004861.1 hypothetical protein [Paludisphaera mucosa]